MNTYVVTDKLRRVDGCQVGYTSRTPCDDIWRMSLDDSPDPDASLDPFPDADAEADVVANAVTDADAEAVAAVGVVGVVGVVVELDSTSSERDS